MKVEQLTISLDSKAGTIVDVANLLAGNGINIRALSLSDVRPYGMLRILVNDPDHARKILTEQGFEVRPVEILVLEVPDKPGGLASVLKTITDSGLSVEYLYAFTQQSGKSGLIIFRITDIDAARKVLGKAGIRVLSAEEVCAV